MRYILIYTKVAAALLFGALNRRGVMKNVAAAREEIFFKKKYIYILESADFFFFDARVKAHRGQSAREATKEKIIK